jgi:ankyrin repeat protein
MAAESDRETAADPGGSAGSQKSRRFLQFTMREFLLLLAVSGVLLALVAPKLQQRLRAWRLSGDVRKMATADVELAGAVRANDLSRARSALAAGANPDFMSNQPGSRVIFDCIAKGQLEMMNLLLDSGADAEGTESVRFIGPGGGGPPLFVALNCDQPPEVRCQMVRVLVAAGANPRRQEGRTNAMDLAVHRSDSQMGDLLREYGLPYGPREMATFNRLDELRPAVDNDPELVKQRFKSMYAAGPNDGPTLLAIALRGGYREMSLFLIDAGAPLDARQHLGRTLLHEAASGGDPELIRLLVARGLNVNAVDDHFHDPPLECAVGHDKAQAVAALLEAGADVNQRGANGRPPLYTAVLGKHVKIVQMLLAAGADPTIADMSGQTPMDLARAQNPALAKVLEQAIQQAANER